MDELVRTLNLWLEANGVSDVAGFWRMVYVFATVLAFLLIGVWRSE